jgi:ribose transport system ATP-binding protein
MESKALEIFRKFNVYIDPKMAVEDLSSAQKQIVEIAKAISRNARILIMDEPSAPLTVSEVDCMFDMVKTLKNHGVTILYISHRLDEVFELADRVTVLRDGQLVETKIVKDSNRQELIQLMVNRPLKETFPAKDKFTW